MGQLVEIPLPLGTYNLPEGPAGNTQLINYMPQVPAPEFSGKIVVVPTPGLVSQTSGGSGPVRAMVVLRDTSVTWVSGAAIYNSALGAVGSIAATGVTTMATDGITTLTAVAGRLYSTVGGSTTDITSTCPFTPGSVCFLNGYFVISVYQSNVFFISGLNAITFDPLDFATCEGGSSSIYGCLSIHLDVWFFCHDTIEVWYLSGAADFPFQRQLGGFLEVGTQANNAAAKCDNTVYWLGNDRKVYRADGYAPVVVSDASLDAWMVDRTMEDAVAISLELNGQNCFMLTFPTENTTWVFTTLVKRWFTMSTNGLTNRWRGNCAAVVGGNFLVGDVLSGSIMAIEPGVFTDIGIPIARLIQFQQLFARSKRTFMGRLAFDIYATVSVDTMLLQWADESGAFNTGRTLQMDGAPGVRIFETRLGSFFRRLIRLSGSPQGNVTILGAFTDVTPSIELNTSDDNQ